MFTYCNNLEYIEINIPAEYIGDYYTSNWLQNAGMSVSNPVFKAPYSIYPFTRDNSGVPTNFKIVYTDVPESVLSGISATEAALTMN